MFSGQGSQYYEMGKELYASNSVFRSWMLRLDEVVRQAGGWSVLPVLYGTGKKKNESFVDIRFTHPAIFMVEYALTQVLLAEGIKPDYVLGASLGEYAAAALAKVMEAEEMLEILVRQANLLDTRCKPGGMLAVLAEPALYQQDEFINENSEMAAENYSTHFVLSGELEKLALLERYLKKKGIITQQLPVSHGFHSFLLDPAAQEYLALLKTKKFNPPLIPMISCLYGNQATSVGPEYFWEVARRPIRFARSIEFLENRGTHVYLDLGPSGTLAGFAKRLLAKGSKSLALPVLTPFGKELDGLSKIRDLIPAVVKIKKERTVQKMTAYLFPGQGSQHKGMGKTLFDEFKDLTAQADEILGYSIRELCLEDPENKLTQTRYTQPALYVVNALSYLKKIEETGKKPAYTAGHSLGEYNALLAAGSFDFATGLRLVQKRGELMSRVAGGGMAAVIGLSPAKIAEVLEAGGFKSIDIANFNSTSQTVISGPAEDIEKARAAFEKAGAKMYAVLKVSGAFHSRYMEEVKAEFAEFLDNYQLMDPIIPVISNVRARPYRKGEVKRNLVDQITGSVKWLDSIRYLMGKGVVEMEQVGPGNILTELVKNILKEAQPLYGVDEEKDEAEQETAGVKAFVEETAAPHVQQAEEAGPVRQDIEVTAFTLGDREFKKDYNLKYAYLAGSMYRGISSKEMVVRLGKAGMMGFFGTGGLDPYTVEEAIRGIQSELSNGEPYGLNLVYNPVDPGWEENMVDLFIKYGIRNVEASAYMSVSKALARYRLKGLYRNDEGKVRAANRVIAKLSRPEVAEIFLSPVPQRFVDKLLAEKSITSEEARLSPEIALADDICVEADSAGHTDRGVAAVLMPAMLKLRDEMMAKYRYPHRIRVGAAGGIGAPESAAAAFILGAEFIVTGSINQCTVEAGTSEVVKDMLEDINVQDTDYAPAGDMFELGAKVQVLRKGVFFPARASKLFDLYRRYDSLEELDEKMKEQIQERYFQKSFEEVWEEVCSYCPAHEIEKARNNPKHKMALVFRWYSGYSTHLALKGVTERKVDFQVQCGPALGAFNQWVKGTPLEKWKNRHVDEIGRKLMEETALLLKVRFKALCGDGGRGEMA
jgi:trans-AT polyketide synthase/acyltransferase/oxidoreductase domain-containing protein